MPTSLEYLRIVAKQFAAVPDAEAQAWLDIAAVRNAAACLTGDIANLALAYYVAHMLALDLVNTGGEGGRGAIKSEKEGDLERTYATPVAEGTLWGLTPYGQQYADMTAGCYGATIMTRFGSTLGVAGIAPYADDLPFYGY